MLDQKYISCLVNLSKPQIIKGINEIKDTYPNKISFTDILICIKYNTHKKLTNMKAFRLMDLLDLEE